VGVLVAGSDVDLVEAPDAGALVVPLAVELEPPDVSDALEDLSP
jgi:hypothetical protein